MLNNLKLAGNVAVKENFDFAHVLKGILISYIITIPAFMVFALILANTDFPEKFLTPAVLVTTIISVLTAASTAARGLKNKGWLNGAIIGFVYMVVLYIISSIIYKNFSIDKYVINMTVIGVLTGAIGGIVGINLKKNKHWKYKK